MRKVKFRAWKRPYKKLLGGIEPGKMYDDVLCVYSAKQAEVRDGLGIVRLNFHEGHAFDLMQYIGINKKGKEVYEGDILNPITHLKAEGNKVVEYSCDSGIAGFVAGDLQWDELDEVIGNIYQNPELLEDK